MTESRGSFMVIEESRMKFEFPDNSDVIKFDDTSYYRKEFNTLPGAKGVDFISVDREYVAFIEVKNCSGDEGNCRWRIFPNNLKRDKSHTNVDVEGRNSLDIEVAEKTAMTLAALSGIRSFGETRSSLEELKQFADRIVLKYLSDTSKKKIYIILILEGDFGGYTRSKKSIMHELQSSLNAKMRWFHCKVSVVDSTTYSHDIFQIIQ
jgi:hypothetical protein